MGPNTLEGVAAIITALALLVGAFKGGEWFHKRRSGQRSNAMDNVARQLTVDEGDNGDATFRKAVRQGFEDIRSDIGELVRQHRQVRDDVRDLFKAVEREARLLKAHEESEERTLAGLSVTIRELALRFEETLPDPPAGMPERRAGRQPRTRGPGA